ncbi:glycosyltransferase family 1 protein [Variovorax sp. J22P168]|uniref:glycosyltransferase family 4 protein n=1 Tax=Variovorax jilinensis TaxID=3053513 RepID=UPI0025772643|nr:glycosyltransferase family 1 protein [Variovorax sp. J22P168]MDM0011633.1 glycosyltransferase family 1 protein [Variovorax sp. J22P168]
MKVLLVTNYVPDQQNSMLAFRRVLERELPHQGCEVRVVAPAERVLRFAPSARWRKWFGYVDKFILFIPALRRAARWADVVHVTDHSNGMYIPWIESKPNVATCHDVIAIQAAKGHAEGWQVGFTGRVFQRLIARGLGHADIVACVSELTRRELLALNLVEPSRVTSAHNGLNDDFAPMPAQERTSILARLGVPAGSYLLHVGMQHPRKNRERVLDAFIALQARAAAAGRAPVMERLVFVGPPPEGEMLDAARKHGVADRIVALEGISHAELRAVYGGATALLFPSLQEGFGWPVIEAQASGCPVFTSNFAPMNEIGGEGAVYVDARDPVAMAQAIEEAAPRLEEMRRLGLENAAHYTPSRMAAAYVAAYALALERRGGQPR